MNGAWRVTRCGNGRCDWSAPVDGSSGCRWLALRSSGRGVRWTAWGVFTHRPNVTAAAAASERNRSARNLSCLLEWTSLRGSAAFSRVALHPAGLRSPPVSPLCVWPSSPQPAARSSSLSPGGRLWKDWGDASLGDWDCRQTRLSLYTNTGELASYTKLHLQSC